MNFPTTGLPAWPQASARASGLPVTQSDGFALAVDGAMALVATADGSPVLTAGATPAVADGDMLPRAAAIAVPIANPVATQQPMVGTAAPVLRLLPPPVLSQSPSDARIFVGPIAPAMPAIAASNAFPEAEPAPRPIAGEAILGKARQGLVPPGAASVSVPTPSAAQQTGLADPTPYDPARADEAQPALPTQEPPAPTTAKATTLTPAPKATLAKPDTPAQPDATIATAPERTAGIPDPDPSAAPRVAGRVVAAPGLTVTVASTVPRAPAAEQLAADATTPPARVPASPPEELLPAAGQPKIVVSNLPAALALPSAEAVAQPTTGRARGDTPLATPAAADAIGTQLGLSAAPATATATPFAPAVADRSATKPHALAPTDEANTQSAPLPIAGTSPAIQATARPAEPTPVQAAVTPPSAKTGGAIAPTVETTQPATVAPPVAVARRIPRPFDITTPTAPILTGTVNLPTTAAVEPVPATSGPIAHNAALPGVLAAQTVPLMRAASPAATAAVPASVPDATPPAPAPLPLPTIAPLSAMGGDPLSRQSAPADPSLDTAPPSPTAQTAAPGAPVPVAAQPGPKALRAKPPVAAPTPSEMPPAPTVVPTPDASATPSLRAASPEPPVADPPRRPAPDEPDPADQPATPAFSAPILPQTAPTSVPIPAPAARVVDTAKPNSMRRASPALGSVTLGPQPAAARDTADAPRDRAPSTVAPDAPKFADALPAPTAGGDAEPALAPLLTAEPLGALSPQPAAPRAHAVDAVPTPIITAQPGQIGRDLGVEIARRVSAGGNELIVRLAPAELGRIEVRMSFDDRGGLTTVIAADSPVALDMLRRDSADLSRSLSDAGFRNDGQSLRFDSGSDRGGGGGQPRSPWQNATPKPDRPGEFGPASDFDPSPYRPLRTSGRYDLMA